MLDKEIVQSIIQLVSQRSDIEQAIDDFKKMYNAVTEIMSTKKTAVEKEEALDELNQFRQNPLSSIQKDYIICLECGEKLSVLAPHLRNKHQITARDYKKKWGMKLGTKLVSENYRKKRQKIAKNINTEERIQKMLAAKKRKTGK